MTTRQKIATAIGLWVMCAFLVWNDVLDRILVLAGRRYSHDAVVQFRQSGTYLRIDDVMRPAAAHGVRVATIVALAIVVAALLAVREAAKRDAARADVSRGPASGSR